MGASLGSSWGILGTSWQLLGASWERLEASRAILGRVRASWEGEWKLSVFFLAFGYKNVNPSAMLGPRPLPGLPVKAHSLH